MTVQIDPCNVSTLFIYNRSMQTETKSEIFSKFILMTVQIGPCNVSTLYLSIGPCNVRPKVKYFQNLYS